MAQTLSALNFFTSLYLFFSSAHAQILGPEELGSGASHVHKDIPRLITCGMGLGQVGFLGFGLGFGWSFGS